jgi:hypothetical protein
MRSPVRSLEPSLLQPSCSSDDDPRLIERVERAAEQVRLAAGDATVSLTLTAGRRNGRPLLTATLSGFESGPLEFVFVQSASGFRLGRGHATVPDMAQAIHVVGLMTERLAIRAAIRSEIEPSRDETEWAVAVARRLADTIDLSRHCPHMRSYHWWSTEILAVDLWDDVRSDELVFTGGGRPLTLDDNFVSVWDLGEALHLVSLVFEELKCGATVGAETETPYPTVL